MWQSWTQLFLRSVLGTIFFAHGWEKWQSGYEMVAARFEALGVPGQLAVLVTVLELVAGAALMIGVATRYAAIGLALLMAGVIVWIKWEAGLLGTPQARGYEMDLALLAMALYVAASRQEDSWLHHWRKWTGR